MRNPDFVYLYLYIYYDINWGKNIELNFRCFILSLPFHYLELVHKLISFHYLVYFLGWGVKKITNHSIHIKPH